MKIYTAFSLIRLPSEKFVAIVEKILKGEQLYKKRDGTILNGTKD